MARTLNYNKPCILADYGVDIKSFPLPKLTFKLPNNYLLFIHNASWTTKLWPLSSWQSLIRKAVRWGYSILLPSGNTEEYKRAQKITQINDKAYALPKLSLKHIAALIKNSQGVVCSDTGLAHVAAIADIPMVTIYGATNPK